VKSPLRVYIETSVFGGYFDPEFSEDTREFFDRVSENRVNAVVSEMVAAEIARAPQQVQLLLKTVIDGGAEFADLTQTAVDLQAAYLNSGALSRRWENDAMHVAVATEARVDAIATWNFKHLLNPRRIRAFNGINLAGGYGLVTFLSPTDIVRHLKELP